MAGPVQELLSAHTPLPEKSTPSQRRVYRSENMSLLSLQADALRARARPLRSDCASSETTLAPAESKNSRSSSSALPLRPFSKTGSNKSMKRDHSSRSLVSSCSSKNTEPLHKVRFDVDRFGYVKEDVFYYEAPTELEKENMYTNPVEEELNRDLRDEFLYDSSRDDSEYIDSVSQLFNDPRRQLDRSLSLEALSASDATRFAERSEQEAIKIVSGSELRGFEASFCNVIVAHRSWAVRKVLSAQNGKRSKGRMAELAAAVSIRSRDFALKVAAGDAEEAAQIFAEVQMR